MLGSWAQTQLDALALSIGDDEDATMISDEDDEKFTHTIVNMFLSGTVDADFSGGEIVSWARSKGWEEEDVLYASATVDAVRITLRYLKESGLLL